ncbi:unnamed protein product, partial [Lymnaea stagnalis]
MAGSGDEMRFIEFQDLERYKQERRCMHCKIRTFDDMVTCTKCLEFCYCSIECLENDSKGHATECNIIGLRKGRRRIVDINMLEYVKQKAKLLDEDGDPIDVKSHPKANPKPVDEIKDPKAKDQQNENVPAYKPGPKNKKNKRKNKSKRRKAPNPVKPSSQTPDLSSTIVRGRFGGRVKVDDNVRSGARFGEGWWTSGRPSSSGGGATGHATEKTIYAKKPTKTSFPEYDSDTDSDDGLKLCAMATVEDATAKSSFCDSGPTGSVDATPKEADGKVKVGPASSANQTWSGMNAASPSGSSDATRHVRAFSAASSCEASGKVKERSPTCSSEPASKVNERSAASSREPASKVRESSPTSSGEPASVLKERSAPCTNGASNTYKVTSATLNSYDNEYQPTGDELVPYDQKKAEEAMSAAGRRDSGKSPVLEKCLFCGKESYSMLKCSRCFTGRYCGKICQKQDFPRHKESCRRGGRFLVALDKIPDPLVTAAFLGLGIPPISVFLSDLCGAFEYLMIGPRRSLLLEIVDTSVFVFQYSVRAMDRDGTMCRILFYEPSGIYYHVPNGL